MTHKSLFNPDRGYINHARIMEYEGNIESVLSDLRNMGKSYDPDNAILRAEIFWHAPRIIRGVIDYKIENDMENPVGIVNQATKTVMDIYSNPRNTGRAIEYFADCIQKHSLGDMLKWGVKQGEDDTTWRASKPERSLNNVELMMRKFGGRDILMLAMAYGGIPAGLDIFLWYNNDSCSWKNSIIYPARYSRYKHKDETPRLSDAEIEYLRAVRGDRPVLIFDEDSYSGKTLRLAKEYIQNNLFPGTLAFVMTNEGSNGNIEKINKESKRK